MSLGYCALGKLKCQDDIYVYYLYSGENWNDKDCKIDDRLLYDGLIKIDKNIFNKDNAYYNNISSAIMDGKIQVVIECRNAFYRFNDIKFDYLALRIVYNIFKQYRINYVLPEKVGFIQ